MSPSCFASLCSFFFKTSVVYAVVASGTRTHAFAMWVHARGVLQNQDKCLPLGFKLFAVTLGHDQALGV